MVLEARDARPDARNTFEYTDEFLIFWMPDCAIHGVEQGNELAVSKKFQSFARRKA
jgi:hypothetical protein